MSMNQWAVRTVAGAAMVLASMAFGTAHAATSVAAAGGVFTQASNTTAELASTNPGLAQMQAIDLFINAAGVPSFDGPAAAGNTVLTFNVTPGALVDAISYNLSLATVGASWLSEATISFLNSNGDGVVLSAGFGEDDSGTGTYVGSALLSSLGLSFNIGADGLLIVEFYESFDDVLGAADANWTSGGITLGNIGVVPEPGTYGMMALGMLAVVVAARRRKA